MGLKGEGVAELNHLYWHGAPVWKGGLRGGGLCLFVHPWGSPISYMDGCKVRAWLLSASNSRCTKSVSALRISTCRIEAWRRSTEPPTPQAVGQSSPHKPHTRTYCRGAFSPQPLQEGSDAEGSPHNHCDPLWDSVSAPHFVPHTFCAFPPPPPPSNSPFPHGAHRGGHWAAHRSCLE